MKTKKLSELSKKIFSGLTPLRSNPEFWNNADIPWLKTEQLGDKYIYETNEYISKIATKKTSISICSVNTLSIAMYGEGKTRGNLSIIKKPMATNQACCNIEIDPKKAHFEYVYYYLKTQYEELRKLSSGIRKNLNSSDIKNYPIKIPYFINEQIKIANVLKVLDDKIQLNNQINAELEAMAKTLYDYWFVQFDFPDENGKPYKSSGGKMFYNAELKREIPVGWEVSTVDKILDNVPTSEKISNKSIKNIGKFPVIDQSQDYICGFTDNILSIITPIKPHIVFGDHTRAVKLVNFKYARGADGTKILISKNDKICGYVLYFSILNIEIPNYGYARHYKFLKDSKIIIPDIKITSNFNSTINSFFEKIKLNIFENHELKQLRDWLLPMLMNGQVVVS